MIEKKKNFKEDEPTTPHSGTLSTSKELQPNLRQNLKKQGTVPEKITSSNQPFQSSDGAYNLKR